MPHQFRREQKRRHVVSSKYTWPCSLRPGSPAHGPLIWLDTSPARHEGLWARAGPARSYRPCLGRCASPRAGPARHGNKPSARGRPGSSSRLPRGLLAAQRPRPTALWPPGLPLRPCHISARQAGSRHPRPSQTLNLNHSIDSSPLLLSTLQSTAPQPPLALSPRRMTVSTVPSSTPTPVTSNRRCRRAPHPLYLSLLHLPFSPLDLGDYVSLLTPFVPPPPLAVLADLVSSSLAAGPSSSSSPAPGSGCEGKLLTLTLTG